MYTSEDYKRDKIISATGSGYEKSMAELRCIHYEHGRIGEADRLLQQSPYANENTYYSNTSITSNSISDKIIDLEHDIKNQKWRQDMIESQLAKGNNPDEESLRKLLSEIKRNIRDLEDQLTRLKLGY